MASWLEKHINPIIEKHAMAREDAARKLKEQQDKEAIERLHQKQTWAENQRLIKDRLKIANREIDMLENIYNPKGILQEVRSKAWKVGKISSRNSELTLDSGITRFVVLDYNYKILVEKPDPYEDRVETYWTWNSEFISIGLSLNEKLSFQGIYLNTNYSSGWMEGNNPQIITQSLQTAIGQETAQRIEQNKLPYTNAQKALEAIHHHEQHSKLEFLPR